MSTFIGVKPLGIYDGTLGDFPAVFGATEPDIFLKPNQLTRSFSLEVLINIPSLVFDCVYYDEVLLTLNCAKEPNAFAKSMNPVCDLTLLSLLTSR